MGSVWLCTSESLVCKQNTSNSQEVHPGEVAFLLEYRTGNELDIVVLLHEELRDQLYVALQRKVGASIYICQPLPVISEVCFPVVLACSGNLTSDEVDDCMTALACQGFDMLRFRGLVSLI